MADRLHAPEPSPRAVARACSASDLCEEAGQSAWVLLLVSTLLAWSLMYGKNDVMGEIQFEGKSKVEKTSGVWVDGEYVGYLKELKGSKKVLLLPGNT